MRTYLATISATKLVITTVVTTEMERIQYQKCRLQCSCFLKSRTQCSDGCMLSPN